ncbi:hypothetical protein A3E39_03490 [Candidatus Uhrbacteria bacterium RIFCSPHIGHO2_12_FULL_60_25]|uniref:Rod shape-determining protein MreD n=1 Tax=Candidatus Uhrbacteria bacterium RIFCSPHIGHO2_12_FULL_60_25 TaxID=1802399 RepID=A0A1F7UKQ7_9BACT|nr:MAG: hypothetical protein A3D73_03505 [Candidatus Uhrbacteria bacterium RIFCSPHIGHO2_02_FULL_60_44]OGL78866.1 MAG: hypothetical protein A3E39_03490 [Candidatus Uhrbacteria bacterium RIFCSPHIGHO2_12_FULL_60_25]
MRSRHIITVVLALLAGLFDATVASWFPGNLMAIRLALPLVTVLAAFSSLERAVPAALASGIVLDVLLPSSSGFVTFRYVALALGVAALSRTILTNRSLMGAYALGFVALVIDRVLLFAMNLLTRAFTSSAIPEIRASFIAEALWLAACITFVFVLFAAFTRRFLPPVSRTIGLGGRT